MDILAHEAEGKEQAEESVEGSREGHSDAIRSRKTVGVDGGTEGAREKDTEMGYKKEWCPEDRGADGEMVFEMAGGGAELGFGLVIFVEARAAEAFVGKLVVLGEIEAVLDQRSAGKGIIADAVAADPGIQKRKREEPEKEKEALRFA